MMPIHSHGLVLTATVTTDVFLPMFVCNKRMQSTISGSHATRSIGDMTNYQNEGIKVTGAVTDAISKQDLLIACSPCMKLLSKMNVVLSFASMLR